MYWKSYTAEPLSLLSLSLSSPSLFQASSIRSSRPISPQPSIGVGRYARLETRASLSFSRGLLGREEGEENGAHTDGVSLLVTMKEGILCTAISSINVQRNTCRAKLYSTVCMHLSPPAYSYSVAGRCV